MPVPSTQERETHPRAIMVCRICGLNREHYTRTRNGRREIMTPCAVCFTKRQHNYYRRKSKERDEARFPPLRPSPQQPTDPSVVTEF